jgi:dihydrolipoamide dehydrogenase
MPEKQVKTDVTILGGGPGGYVAALRAAQLGLNVSLVEADKIGGTCLNYGCIPTKALLRSAEIYRTMRDAKNYGCIAGEISFDWALASARKNRVVATIRKGIDGLLAKRQVTVYNGRGTVRDASEIEVETDKETFTLTTDALILATGSNAVMPPIPGIDLPGVVTSSEALAFEHLPKSIAVIGAGVIGMEFAFLFASLGVEVTVIEMMERMLPQLDSDISAEVRESANKMRINLFTSTKVEKIEKGGETLNVTITEHGMEKSIRAEKVLVAAGRKPNYGGFDPAELGLVIHPDRKAIAVDHGMRTSRKHVFAIGDVTNILPLAHVASMQGEVAAENLVHHDAFVDYAAIPWAIFTYPEVAVVGVDQNAVRRPEIDSETHIFPFAAIGKSGAYGERKGFVKIHCSGKNGRIMGGAVVGPGAAEMIHEIALAVRNELTAEHIERTIHAHPTFSEAIREAAMIHTGKAIHYSE